MTKTRKDQIAELQQDWATNPRWANVKRGYTAEDVVRLRGSVQRENTLARNGARKLWDMVNREGDDQAVRCLGALTGGQAVQQAKRVRVRKEMAGPMHTCSVCGRTSNDDLELGFRYRTEGDKEVCYCEDHLPPRE